MKTLILALTFLSAAAHANPHSCAVTALKANNHAQIVSSMAHDANNQIMRLTQDTHTNYMNFIHRGVAYKATFSASNESQATTFKRIKNNYHSGLDAGSAELRRAEAELKQCAAAAAEKHCHSEYNSAMNSLNQHMTIASNLSPRLDGIVAQLTSDQNKWTESTEANLPRGDISKSVAALEEHYFHPARKDLQTATDLQHSTSLHALGECLLK